MHKMIGGMLRIVDFAYKKMQTFYWRLQKISDSQYYTMVFFYVLISLVWFWPYVFADQVVSPSNIWSNWLIPNWESQIENQSFLQRFLQRNNPLTPEFSDIISHTIPETSYLLRGFSESGNILLWNNLTGLGRQSQNFSANGSMNFVVWVINIFTDDVFRFITFRNLATIFLGGFFMMLLLKELRVQPITTLITGVVTMTLPLYSYWSTFFEFYVGMTCCLIIMYAMYRSVYKKNLYNWFLISLVCYFILITAYMQHNLFHAYFLAGVMVIIVVRKLNNRVERIRYFAFVASAVGVGFVLAAPVLVDIYVASLSTARSLSFGNQLPERIPNLYEIAQFFLPVSYGLTPWNEYEQPHLMFQLLRGRHITLFMGVMLMVGLLRNWQKTKGLFVFLCISFAFTYIPFIHNIGANYFFPTVSGWIKFFDFAPLFIVLLLIVAYGLDAILTQPPRFSKYDIVIPVFVVFMYSLIIIQGLQQSLPIRWWYLGVEFVGVVIILLMMWAVATTHVKSWSLLFFAFLIGIVVSFPLMYRHPHADMLHVPSLMKTLQRYVAPDSYMARYKWRFHPLGNQHIYYNVPSIHMYHNLISKYYLNFMEDIGVVDPPDNKYFASFEGDYNSLSFWLANVSVIIAPSDVVIEDLPIIKTDGVNTNIYKIKHRGFALQINLQEYGRHVRFEQKEELLHATIDDPRTYKYRVPQKILSTSDKYELNTTYEALSLMVFSQIFDSRWNAYVLIDNQWQRAESVVVNDIFQGVRVPADATRVRMAFMPWTRFMVYGHMVWGILLLFVIRDIVRRVYLWVTRNDSDVVIA